MSKIYKYYADNGNRIRIIEPDSILGYITIKKNNYDYGASVNMVGVSKAHMDMGISHNPKNDFRKQPCFECDETTHRNLVRMLNSPDKDSFTLAYAMVKTNLK